MKLVNILNFVLFFILIYLSFEMPVAVLYGFRQSCDSGSFKNLVEFIHDRSGQYTKCIESGGGNIDISRSFEDQAKEACKIISSDSNYDSGFAIVSISQGGVLARYIIEKCQMKGKVLKFISIGGPLAGTHQLPRCFRGVVCHILNSFADWFCYKGYVQKTMGPSGYFRVSNHLEKFKKSKALLLDLNNQGKTYDSEAKRRFYELEKLVLIGFKRDTMISPEQSAFFAEFDDKHNLIEMKDTESYKKDLFGLKTLDEANKIKMIFLDERHCRYSFQNIQDYIIPEVV
jgi:palmitoyl-protein thioesterase